jgi:hypothetical protein
MIGSLNMAQKRLSYGGADGVVPMEVPPFCFQVVPPNVNTLLFMIRVRPKMRVLTGTVANCLAWV